jgi:hypothetical protein
LEQKVDDISTWRDWQTQTQKMAEVVKILHVSNKHSDKMFKLDNIK